MNGSPEAAFVKSASEPEPHTYVPLIGIVTFKLKKKKDFTLCDTVTNIIMSINDIIKDYSVLFLFLLLIFFWSENLILAIP